MCVRFGEFREHIPFPRVRRQLPGILSREEVAQMINAAGTLFRRTLLMVLYGTGMRRAEAARLRLADIDSQRKINRVVNGKGGKDRDLPMSPALLELPRKSAIGSRDTRTQIRRCFVWAEPP
jgi:integrase